jgi:hypothetical protein
VCLQGPAILTSAVPSPAGHPAGSPMTLGNMRELGVQRLIASCLNDVCRHTALIDVSSYSAETEVPSFGRWAASNMSHKFILGQAVEYRGRHAPSGIYVVTAKLPERDGEFEYHIRHPSEPHNRIARESELHEARR